MPGSEMELEVEMGKRLDLAHAEMKQETSMEGVCRILEKAEAQYYLCVEDCPQAKELASA